jgi:hypothetical protein
MIGTLEGYAPPFASSVPAPTVAENITQATVLKQYYFSASE